MTARELREVYRNDTKQEPIRDGYKPASEYTREYIEWMQEQLCDVYENIYKEKNGTNY